MIQSFFQGIEHSNPNSLQNLKSEEKWWENAKLRQVPLVMPIEQKIQLFEYIR